MPVGISQVNSQIQNGEYQNSEDTADTVILAQCRGRVEPEKDGRSLSALARPCPGTGVPLNLRPPLFSLADEPASKREPVRLDLSERHDGTMYTVPEQKAGVGLKLSVDGITSVASNTDITQDNELIQRASLDFNMPLQKADYDKALNIEIMSTKPLTGKQYLLVIPITKFFRKMRNLYILINILNGRSVISLRLIEYFVVNYVLENNTYYNLEKYKYNPAYIVDNLFANDNVLTAEQQHAGNSTIEDTQQANRQEIQQAIHQRDKVSKPSNNFDNYFLIHDNYKCQLKEYNKKNFDPFCRWTRIRMYYDKTKYFFTTVAQLNFFKWAIENYILDYILDNLDTIEKSMNDYEKAIKKEKRIRKLNSLLETAPNTETAQLSKDQLITKPQISQQSFTIIPAPEVSAPDIMAKLNIGKLLAKQDSTQHQSIPQDSANPFNMINMDTVEPIVTQQSKSTSKEALPSGADLSYNQTMLGRSGNRTSNLESTVPALILSSTLDKKTKIKGRKKKEFTKTNRSILKYECTKIINFD